MHIEFQIQKAPKGAKVYLFDEMSQLSNLLSKEELHTCATQLKRKVSIQVIFKEEEQIFLAYLEQKQPAYAHNESVRNTGAELQKELQKYGIKEIGVTGCSGHADHTYLFLEGLVLASYQFLKYRSDARDISFALKYINVERESILPTALKKLTAIVSAVYHARNLVNEPNSFLTATRLAEECKRIGKEGMVRVNVYSQAKIEQLGMGGLLAVNKGSTEPASFTILEHKPAKARNKQPIVLVGKGVVYDTGGLSLKPTLDSMDKMKSDMSGAAVVMGILYVLGSLDIPLHVIGLIPATDNRPGGNAYAPGDIIKMYSGLTVEVLNTDAEGRMILADALHFASRYKPEWVADFATLTGAASAAIGEAAMVAMGTIDEAAMEALQQAGLMQNEKITVFPFWDEYADLLKSPVADLKNIGGSKAGAITAGKFLERFTDYPWVHFDIAGVSFRDGRKSYLAEGGTGYGIRMMAEYLIALSEH